MALFQNPVPTRQSPIQGRHEAFERAWILFFEGLSRSISILSQSLSASTMRGSTPGPPGEDGDRGPVGIPGMDGEDGWPGPPSLLTNTTGIQRVTVVLSDTDIKALPTTPIVLVPAPGSNLALLPITAFVNANTSAGAYTNIDVAAWLSITYVGSSVLAMAFLPNDTSIVNTDVGTTALTDFLAATHKVGQFGPYAATEGVDEWGPVPKIQTAANVQNAGLEIRIDNQGAGNLTGGNAANTITVTLFYATV